jgi:serine/threonine protein phosphatase 1
VKVAPWLKALVRAQRRSPPLDILPDEDFFVIGDIHGCMAILVELLAVCETFDPDARLVFVGDYIDRGEDSAAVLSSLADPSFLSHRKPVFLIGNHEEMLLDFLDGSDRVLPVWLANGGTMTLASLGLDAIGPKGTEISPDRLRGALKARLGVSVLAWLRSLHVSWASGNVVVSHAGVNQDGGRAGRGIKGAVLGQGVNQTARLSGDFWSVEGHTIVKEPSVRGSRILVDVGAYASTRLAAAHFSRQRLVFLTSRGEKSEHPLG